MRTNDLEGIVAKRLADPYDTHVRWLKIKNPDIRRRKVGARCSMGHGIGMPIQQANDRN